MLTRAQQKCRCPSSRDCSHSWSRMIRHAQQGRGSLPWRVRVHRRRGALRAAAAHRPTYTSLSVSRFKYTSNPSSCRRKLKERSRAPSGTNHAIAERFTGRVVRYAPSGSRVTHAFSSIGLPRPAFAPESPRVRESTGSGRG
jgi:hypothetical protein